jgi:hypothetical protein
MSGYRFGISYKNKRKGAWDINPFPSGIPLKKGKRKPFPRIGEVFPLKRGKYLVCWLCSDVEISRTYSMSQSVEMIVCLDASQYFLVLSNSDLG